MLLANLEKPSEVLRPGLYVCLPGSLSGVLVNLEVVIRSVVYDEDKPFCKTAVSKKMCKESRLTCITKHVIRSSPSFRFSFSVISDKNNKGHHSQT